MAEGTTAARASIRSARLEDAPAIAPLSTELGYPATAAEVAGRLAGILPDATQLVAVAEVAGQVVGWIHAACYLTVEVGATVEIRGLVVGEGKRSAGLGRALVEHAEGWARRRGVPVIRVRSNVVRAGAHAFYARLGYAPVKTQHVFSKRLDI